MKKILYFIIVTILVLSIAGYAATANPPANTPAANASRSIISSEAMETAKNATAKALNATAQAVSGAYQTLSSAFVNRFGNDEDKKRALAAAFEEQRKAIEELEKKINDRLKGKAPAATTGTKPATGTKKPPVAAEVDCKNIAKMNKEINALFKDRKDEARKRWNLYKEKCYSDPRAKQILDRWDGYLKGAGK